MRSATVRRLALVAGLVLLASLCSVPGTALRLVERSDADAARPAVPAFASTPVVRRHGGPAPLADTHARGLLAVAAAALLVLGLAPRGALAAVRAAPSALARRRHAISLRAPPLAG